MAETVTFVNKQEHQKKLKYLIYTVFLIVAITLPVVYLAGYYAPRANPGSTPVFEHPAGPYSYLIWKDGSTYYAKNGATGAIDYSGTNATQIITNTVAEGNSVFLRKGTYNTDSTIVIDVDFFEFISEMGAEIVYSGSGVALRIGNGDTKRWNIVLHNPNVDARSSSAIIQFYGVARCQIYGGYLYGNNNTGIGIELNTKAASSEHNAYIQIYDTRIREVFKGIVVEGSAGQRSNANTINGVTIFGESNETVGSVGIYIGAGQQNYVRASDIGDMETGILINDTSANQNWIVTPRIEYCKNGIEIISGSYNHILYPIMAQVQSYIVLTGGTETKIMYPDHFQTSGFTTGVVDDTWVAYSLDVTANRVVLTPRQNAYAWVKDRNATHFQVGVSSGTIAIDWYAEYVP